MDPIFANMRRLDARGPASRRVVVDIEGAVLGPDCVLVQRTPAGCRSLDRGMAAVIQEFLGCQPEDPDWFFRQCRRIAAALDAQNVALAQIHGLSIPIGSLDDRQLAALARAAPFFKAHFNSAELRDWHGRWAGAGDFAADEREPTAGELQAHLTDAGYTLSNEVWRAVRDLYRLFMNSGGNIAALDAYLADRGLRPAELPDVVRSLFDPPQPLARLQTAKAPRGFASERELLNYLGPPRPGYEWHHLIEQNGQYRPDLTGSEGIRRWIQHTDNMVQVPLIKHYCISAIMSGKSPSGGRVRDVVRAHSPPVQRDIGFGLLKACGVTP